MMNICVTIPFPSTVSAALAYDVLNVDKELKGSGVTRKLITNGANLEIVFYGAVLKQLRVAFNAFIKNIILVVKTINQFEEGVLSLSK